MTLLLFLFTLMILLPFFIAITVIILVVLDQVFDIKVGRMIVNALKNRKHKKYTLPKDISKENIKNGVDQAKTTSKSILDKLSEMYKP